MSDNYTSVLFCIRDNGTEIYQNGLPIGTYTNEGIYRPHVTVNPTDGSERVSKVDCNAMLHAINASQSCRVHHL